MSMNSGLRVVESVDLQRYCGTWYEIARLPNRFELQCAGEVTANYTLLENGTIRVVNSCKRLDGQFTKAEGVARCSENGPNSKLKVRFAPAFLSPLKWVWADYWILELSPDYSFAVIGGPSLKYFWILSRTPKMSDEIYQGILDRAKKVGYDTANVVKTRQSF